MNVKDYFTFMSGTHDLLYELAEGQAGYFTTAQADAKGVTRQLLRHHERSGAVQRVAHGIYRLTHFPSQPFEDVVIATLWAGDGAVGSHETALAIYGVGEAMPSVTHITVPRRFRGKRPGVTVHVGELPSKQRTVRNGVPVTSIERALIDVAAESPTPVVRSALQDALRQELTTLRKIRRALPADEESNVLQVLMAEFA